MKIDKLFGAIFALLSVIIGAFNSHALKKILPETALESIDVGLRYMMYHGLALLILSILSIGLPYKYFFNKDIKRNIF